MTQKRGIFARGLSHFSLISFLAALSIALVAIPGTAFAATAANPLVQLPDSSAPLVQTSKGIGHHSVNDQITVGLVLKSSNVTQQTQLLHDLYTPGNAAYHQWLNTGDFDARFAPAASDVATVSNYLTSHGMHLISSPSSTLLLAAGSTQQVETTFHTTLNDYTGANGQTFFANSTVPQVPANVAHSFTGVLGLNNAAKAHSDAIPDAINPKLPFPYGGGPYGRGLTPSQIAGIYDVNSVYKKLGDKGHGETLGLFELSGYTRSDINGYEKTFGLPNVPFIDKNVLGGPIAVGGSVDYGAGEVELDIELQIATAPGAKKILVYNAPNTELGGIAGYLQIARDNQADSVSSSWGQCEYYTDTTVHTEELQAFTQIALQGQSIFASAGDNGAYDCGAGTGLTGKNALQVDDPASNPFVTGVGGTAFRKPNQGAITFNPGTNANPSYPGASNEWVWLSHCPTTDNCEGGGGGVSRVWASPDYVTSNGGVLPGIINAGSQTGAYCGQTAPNLCREVPDVSLNADPGTGYAIYCTNTAGGCTDPAYSVHGWTRFGGTSCAAPIWAGVGALYDAYHHGRAGLFNYLVYKYDSTAGYANQLHDITNGNNGYYPAAKTYDLASGLGTPDVYRLITL